VLEERAVDPKGNEFVLREIDCPTCRARDVRVLGLRGGKYHRYGEGIVSRIVQCRRCTLIFPSPFPFPVDHQKLYGDPSKYFVGHDEDAKVDSYRRIVREVRSRTGKEKPSILDVGSGRAELLRAAIREGCTDVVGLEFAAAMIDYAKKEHGLELVPATIEEYAKTAGRTFDGVVLNAVLEHVYDPDAMIAAVRLLLAPGGVLYIDVPRDPNLFTEAVRLANRARRSPAVVNLSPSWPPYHVFGFTEVSLGKLLAKHGLVTEDVVVHSSTNVPHSGKLADRAKAWVASQVYRAGNWTGRAANLFVWARRP
jgi:SAM-dependent methyltransferase